MKNKLKKKPVRTYWLKQIMEKSINFNVILSDFFMSEFETTLRIQYLQNRVGHRDRPNVL